MSSCLEKHKLFDAFVFSLVSTQSFPICHFLKVNNADCKADGNPIILSALITRHHYQIKPQYCFVVLCCIE